MSVSRHRIKRNKHTHIIYIYIYIYNIAVQANLLPTHYEKTLSAMKAKRIVKRITFDRNTANPGETLNVSVPKLNGHEVIVPGSLSLFFDIDLSGGHANNFLVQNVSRALVGKLQDTVGYDIYTPGTSAIT